MVGKRKLTKLSDEALMSELSRFNSREALAVLYERYSKRLLGFLYKLVQGDEALAQDFLQDTFLKVYERRSQFQADRKFYSWLFAIAANHCKNAWRKRSLDLVSLENWQESGRWDKLPVEEKELRQLIRKGIYELDEIHRICFLLRHSEGFSIQEIADITETQPGTVKSRLFYAAKKLAEVLKDV